LSVSDFRELRDDELAKRSDDELIDYMRKARAAGAQAAGRQALSALVWGHVGNVRRRMALRLPSYAVEDAAHDALVRAIGSAFDGTSVGQFRSWLSTITNRTIADFYRYRERHPDPDPLGGGCEGEDERGSRFEPAVGSEDGAVEMQVVIDEVMGELNEDHRRVIELHVFGALPARDVCSQMEGMSPDNVAQIASRFRTRLREQLGQGGSL
jgi:RNA polymerase sigma factor (sigma-70 family)